MKTSRANDYFTYSYFYILRQYVQSNLTPVSIQWIVNLRCSDGMINNHCLLSLSPSVISPFKPDHLWLHYSHYAPFHRFLPPFIVSE